MFVFGQPAGVGAMRQAVNPLMEQRFADMGRWPTLAGSAAASPVPSPMLRNDLAAAFGNFGLLLSASTAAVLIAWDAVGIQAWLDARCRPAAALRYELPRR